MVQSPVVTAAQMHPYHPPQGSDVRHPPPVHSTRDTIRSELCFDRFKFPSHDAAWCPLLHDENIRDKEVRERVMQDPLPITLNQPRNVPPCARILAPTVNAAIMTDLTQDPHQVDESLLPSLPSVEDQYQYIGEVDSPTFDYPWPATVNSATNLSPPGDIQVSDPFEYRSLQE
jgi:hypothetical protein